MTKKEQAIALHNKRYNCCQAVACAFAEESGVPLETLFRAGEGFGLGMGCMECTCGAVSGAVMLAGFTRSDGNTDAPATKAETYKLAREIVTKFIEKNGSMICKELKGIETGKALRSCQGCIEDAVELVQEVLKY
ncbi:MAG: C_GCAxxG_C_C family protein [Lachnospiraceae bacterium]|nr:C_GCAxxG_C_C family protein [Lachnospiraceae bacterium]